MAKIGAEIVVTAKTDYAAQKLKEVADGTNKVRTAADRAGDGVAGMSAKIGRLEGALEKANAGLGRVQGLLGLGGLVGVIGGAASAIDGMIQRSRELGSAQQGLKINLADAKLATGNLVSEYALMTAANKATTLGVVSTGEQFAKMAGIAAKLGASLGGDATQSLEDFTTALGRGSVEILDNLGINLKLGDAYSIYAERIGKAASELTDAEKKTAFMTIAMERAEEAAEKSGVSFDNQASKLARLATRWQDLKDKVANAVTAGVGAAIDPVSTLNDGLEQQIERIQNIVEYTDRGLGRLEDRLVAFADRTDGATSNFANFIGELALGTEALAKLDRVRGEEKQLALARDRYLQLKQEEDQRRRNMKIAERDRNIAEDQLRISNLKSRGDGGPRPVAAANRREINDEASIGVSNALAREAERNREADAQEAAAEALQQKIRLQERELELLQTKASLSGSADEQVAANDAVYASELRLLELQKQATSDRVELFDIETRRRQMALERQLQAQQRAAQQEQKWMQFRQKVVEGTTGGIADALGQVTIAALASAEGERYAVRKSLAAFLEGVRNQMIMTALREGVLAIASAASYDYGGAALHGTAAAAATAAAIAAGAASAGLKASIPSTGGSGGAGGGGGAGVARGGGSGGGASGSGGSGVEGSTVPVSRPGQGAAQPQPQAERQQGAPFAGAKIYVLGATEAQVGHALYKLQVKGQRAMGGGAA